MLVEAKGITGQIMEVINNMLIDSMATMARLDQEKLRLSFGPLALGLAPRAKPPE
jgi:hypothetical protein